MLLGHKSRGDAEMSNQEPRGTMSNIDALITYSVTDAAEESVRDAIYKIVEGLTQDGEADIYGVWNSLMCIGTNSVASC